MKKQSSYDTTWNGNILVTTVTGTINKDDTHSVLEQVKLMVQTLKGAPWANLVDLSQWELGSTDVTPSLIELEDWVRKNGRTHLAFVLGTEYVEIKKFALEKYLGNNLKKNEIILVESLAEGLNWLGKQGFDLKNGNQAESSFKNQN
ncbi:hypothetical protein [uncultured Paraglaciecola sp.]|uniref:hypothetical protein n=1 Tax=uncultured Paraglaciecola sp. TaxID=1765024 RepID=UPI0025EB1D4D|nr:hypothetical protein [uncultured Paraglaciecola sp.]